VKWERRCFSLTTTVYCVCQTPGGGGASKVVLCVKGGRYPALPLMLMLMEMEMEICE
jgi:hypothetical protein